MMQLTYRNARTAMEREMTEHENRLGEANTDLEKLKDVSISVNVPGALLVTLKTH